MKKEADSCCLGGKNGVKRIHFCGQTPENVARYFLKGGEVGLFQ
jgi:hypothetical protein